MSGLWTEASWLTEKPGDDGWEDHGFGHETREQRRDRYVQKVQDVHGVDHNTALNVLKAVSKNLDPVGAGFATQPQHSYDKVHQQLPKGYIDHDTWDRAPILDVDLRHPVHATQNWLKRDQMFHNLFHPGKKPPDEPDLMGHPDVDPDDHRDSEEDDAYWDSRHGDQPAFIRQTDGSHVLIDGHHRVATDMLLGRPTSRGRVVDIRHFGKEGRFRVAVGVLGPRAAAGKGPVITS